MEHLLDDINDLEISIATLFEKVKKDRTRVKRIHKRIRDKKEKLSLIEVNSKEYIKLNASIENDSLKIKDINYDIKYNNKKIDSYENELARKKFLNTVDFI